MSDNSITQIKRRLGASDPVLFVVTHEEHRVVDDLIEIAKNNKYSALLVWTYGVGTACKYAASTSPHKVGTVLTEHAGDPTAPIKYLMTATTESASANGAKDVLMVLKDYGFFLGGGGGFAIGRLLKELRSQLLMERRDSTSVIIVDSESDIPPRMEKVLTLIDFDLPTEEQIAHECYYTLKDLLADKNSEKEIAKLSTLVARTTVGLTLQEVSSALAMSIVATGKVDTQMLLSEKKSIIRKSGVLEYYSAEHDLHVVGGLDNLKGWLRERTDAFSEEAKNFGLPPPRALLMMGVPGCGKSLVAKTIGKEWNMPVLRMDIGSLFGSLVGESESRMRRALKTAEAVAPCVLFIDEMEKGMGKSGGNDGGTSSRVFGNFLTWMSDKTSPVFVVATANDVSSLPPEMLRAGRFDAMFFVDLPNDKERMEIAKIVAAKYGRADASFDWDTISTAASGYSGAEIDTSFVSAMYNAFSAKTDVTTTSWISAISSMVPLSSTMQVEIESLREWSKTRAIPASKQQLASTSESSVKKRFIKGSILG
jgi:ATP-dependent 26S proteasome regulatory subunit